MRLVAALVLLLGIPIPQGREIAVTFDDLPAASAVDRDGAGWARITDDLLTAIARQQVPAIGFVNEQKLERALEDPAYASPDTFVGTEGLPGSTGGH